MGHFLPRLIDLLLPIQQRRQFIQLFWLVLHLAIRGGQPRRRDVEKTIQIDTHRGIKDTAQEIDRAGTAQALVDRIGKGKSMQRRIPIAKLVAGMEAGNPQRRRISHRLGQRLRRITVAQRIQQRIHRPLRIIA